VVAARHSQHAKDELRKESHIETEKDQDRRRACPVFGIEPAGDLRPPIMERAEIGGHHAPDHDVVEVRDDEIRIGDIDVEGEAGEK
jgi:hypothetical protein